MGQVIQTLTNLAIVAGIVFLAIEVRQNQAVLEEANAISLVTAADGIFDDFSDFRESLAQNEQLAEIWLMGVNGEELTPVDALRFDLLCDNLVWASVTAYERYVAFGLDTLARASVEAARDGMANSIGLRLCWEDRRQTLEGWGYESFVAAVYEGGQ